MSTAVSFFKQQRKETSCSFCTNWGSSCLYQLYFSSFTVCQRGSRVTRTMLPYLALSLYWLNERWTSHGLCLNNVVIKKYLDVIHCWHNIGILIQNNKIYEKQGQQHKEPAKYTFSDEVTVTIFELSRLCLSYCVSVLSENESELSPFTFHFTQGVFQWVLFTGQSSNLFQPIVKLEIKSIRLWSWVILP